jgi:hypothetical protein
MQPTQSHHAHARVPVCAEPFTHSHGSPTACRRSVARTNMAEDGAREGRALRLAAGEGDVAALETLLGAAADAVPMLMAADEKGKTALMYAAMCGSVNALRLLLDHPSADAAAMMMVTNSGGSNALMFSAFCGQAAAMRVLLDHASADPAAMMAARSTNGVSALTAAAWFAAGRPTGYPRALPRSCAPLLLLLRRVAVEPHPNDAQQTHMSKVMDAVPGPALERDVWQRPAGRRP